MRKLFKSVEEKERRRLVGLPERAQTLPLGALSQGERFRVELARGLRNGAVVDEFTSNVDR